jgi:F-box-like
MPADVLCKIFILLAQSPSDNPHWSWLNITFVCSAWRQAALECPKLWCHIDFSHPRWTSLTLYRAQELPIFVSATVETHNQSSLLRILQFAPRINAIHLTSSIYNIGPLLGTLKLPHCHLQSFTLEITSPEDNRDIRYSKRSFPWDGPPLPALTELELCRTPFGLVSPRYTGLRRLSLHYLPFSERPMRQDFLSVLEKFTVLEHLILVRAFPKNVTANSVHPTCLVHLPNLRTMSLTGCIQELVNIMECITLPPTCQLQCNVDRLNDSKTSFWKLAKVISAHFHGVASETPLDMLVLTGREESFRFTEAYELNPEFRQTLRVRAYGIDTTHMDPVLDVVIGPDIHTSYDEVVISALVSLWEALPLARLHTLTLRNADAITHKSWPKMLSTLASLRVIDVGGHPPSGLIWALLLNARSYSRLEHDAIHGMLLPNLKDIYLHNIDCFSGGYMVSPSGHLNSHSDLDDSRFLDVLLAYLEDRHRCALSLRSLSISRCTRVSIDTFHDLKGCISHVMWDSQGRYKGEELNPESSATYRQNWFSVVPVRRHFYRLQRLLEVE